MMSKDKKIIKRGDIYYFDFGIAEGSIQSGRRPVLVIQEDKDISTTLNIYTDVTKELKRSEFEGLDSYFKEEYKKANVG